MLAVTCLCTLMDEVGDNLFCTSWCYKAALRLKAVYTINSMLSRIVATVESFSQDQCIFNTFVQTLTYRPLKTICSIVLSVVGGTPCRSQSCLRVSNRTTRQTIRGLDEGQLLAFCVKEKKKKSSRIKLNFFFFSRQ
jgi:hypothetical protein